MANHSDNHGSNQGNGHGQGDGQAHHHIIPNKVLFGIGGGLLVLTVFTVFIAGVDLGRLNFVVAMAVASVKALLVALFFMNLWYDKKENGVMFGTSFLFLAIFITFASMDLFFRGDVYVKGPLTAPAAKSKLKNPWISTPELVSHGKELFAVNCASCHGNEGKGDGPAASALNPVPRNFTVTAGWKNGRRPSMVFKTLKEGLAGSAMASFATMPGDDRWALTHYVLSLSSTAPEKDSPADFKAAGIDPSGGGEAEEKVIPVQLAIERMAVAEAHAGTGSPTGRDTGGDGIPAQVGDSASAGARIYAARCVNCHGTQGEGGIKVRNLGVYPTSFLVTQPFATSLGSADAFNRVVIQGLPGEMMPGNGQLSGAELRELYSYAKSLKGSK